jgi:hypothetical protein
MLDDPLEELQARVVRRHAKPTVDGGFDLTEPSSWKQRLHEPDMGCDLPW